jgi:hypothetical protein
MLQRNRDAGVNVLSGHTWWQSRVRKIYKSLDRSLPTEVGHFGAGPSRSRRKTRLRSPALRPKPPMGPRIGEGPRPVGFWNASRPRRWIITQRDFWRLFDNANNHHEVGESLTGPAASQHMCHSPKRESIVTGALRLRNFVSRRMRVKHSLLRRGTQSSPANFSLCQLKPAREPVKLPAKP